MYAEGVGVGIDAILKSADVARRSLYQHFGGKDGLIEEVLRQAARDTEAAYVRALDAGGTDPAARLEALFDEVARLVEQPDFKGCRYINADLGLSDRTHPAHAITAAHKAKIQHMLEIELSRIGFSDPTFVAEQLQLIIDGALVVGATRPGARTGSAAKALLRRTLEAGA